MISATTDAAIRWRRWRRHGFLFMRKKLAAGVCMDASCIFVALLTVSKPINTMYCLYLFLLPDTCDQPLAEATKQTCILMHM